MGVIDFGDSLQFFIDKIDPPELLMAISSDNCALNTISIIISLSLDKFEL